jgi:hypothetical protein
VEYQLEPPMTPFAHKFTFEPSSGMLQGGDIQVGCCVGDKDLSVVAVLLVCGF